MFICALLGMELFAMECQFNEEGELIKDIMKATKEGIYMSPPRANFDDIFSALTTVFILIIGEDWPGVMYNYTRIYGEKGKFVTLYFVAVLCIGNLMLLSLFTAILLDNFEDKPEDKADEESDDEAIDLDLNQREEIKRDEGEGAFSEPKVT
jgi:hypothetical protein